MTFSNILFIIPARKDSVRLKNKNIRKIGGKTLVQHSIDFVLKLKISILNVIISTNSEKIIKIAKLADHSGSVDTSWGEKLNYNTGEDVIVRHGENDYGVVKKDIFTQTYEKVEQDA